MTSLGTTSPARLQIVAKVWNNQRKLPFLHGETPCAELLNQFGVANHRRNVSIYPGRREVTQGAGNAVDRAACKFQ